jgi:hypothetical protein
MKYTTGALLALALAGCHELGHFDGTKVTCNGKVAYTNVNAVMGGGGAVEVRKNGRLVASLPPADNCRVEKQ